MWRMWKSRSKSGSSIQYGWSRCIGTSTIAAAHRLELTDLRREAAVDRLVRIEVGARSLVDGEAVDVSERGRRLHVQEAAVETCELLHPNPLRARCDVPRSQCRGNRGGHGTGTALCENRRPTTMSETDAPTETSTGWLSPEHLELVRANVPLVYVDAIPVRVDGLGRVTEVGHAAAGRRRRFDQPDGRQRSGAVRRAGARRARCVTSRRTSARWPCRGCPPTRRRSPSSSTSPTPIARGSTIPATTP